jgi:hypothetical protein
MANWPASLPQSLLIPLSIKRQSGKVRSTMDSGPPKQRARFTAVTQEYTSALVLTDAQVTTFLAFYESTLGMGAASFTWIDPVSDSAASLRFKDDPQIDLVRPHGDTTERLYNVTMSLEKLP